MTRNQWWRTTCAFVATMGFMQPTAMFAAETRAYAPGVTIGPRSSDLVAARIVDPAAEPKLTPAQKLALLRQKVKFVFVLFQENRSFDQHFGTFPGADGLFSGGAKPGFTQKIVTAGSPGTVTTISPFKIPNSVVNTAGQTVSLYPADTDSVDHSHAGIVNSVDYTGGQTLNDRYALNEEGLTTDANGNIVSSSTGAPQSTITTSEAQAQKGELVMSHLDCDTVPFLWQYADRFALFDNFHMTITGPSTPNAIAMIAGQSGLTQWALHPGESAKNIAGTSLASSGGEPVTADPGPFAGSNLDYSPVKPPYGPNDESPVTPALNQTYASLPLSFMGSKIDDVIKADENPALDLTDVQSDIATISAKDMPVNWGWYQEGYDHEPTDGPGATTYATYITHHNGPQ
jgi:phospholipase C